MNKLKLFADEYTKGMYSSYMKNLKQVQKELVSLNPKDINHLYQHLEKIKKQLMPKMGTVKEVSHPLLSNDTVLKLVNHCLKFNFDIKQFIKHAKKDVFLASSLIKDPKRQNIYENTAFDVICKTFKSSDPKRTDLFLTDNSITTRKNASSKRIDFVWDYKGYKIYASHKYLKEYGGSQRLQISNVKNFVADSTTYVKTKRSDAKKLFIAICDGLFFEEQQSSTWSNHNRVITSNIHNLKAEIDKRIMKKPKKSK